VVQDIAVMIGPYMPQAASRIASFFGLTLGKERGRSRGFLPAVKGCLSWEDIGRETGLSSVTSCEVLFSKLEDEGIQELRERYSGSQKERSGRPSGSPPAGDIAELSRAAPSKEGAARGETEAAPPVPALAVSFTQTLDLRVAQIVKIERHPKADKLYIETLEIAGPGGASEERIIVSGLVPFYREEELLGKRIILAYNLKPAKLRGVESRGMLLAASDKDDSGTERVEVLDAGDTPTGTRVILEGGEAGPLSPAEIDIDTFFSVPLAVTDYTVVSGDKPLTVGGKPLKTRLIASGEVH
jgi:methionyl-tRNA synthetase